MEFEKMPRRPVTLSQLAANAEFGRWYDENYRRKIRDADGLFWDFHSEMHQTPSPRDPSKMQYDLKLWLESSPTPNVFVADGTLNEEDDHRLIALLGSNEIPLRLKPVELTCQSLEEARNLIMAHREQIAQKLIKTSLKSTKRALIFKFVDSKSWFDSSQNRL